MGGRRWWTGGLGGGLAGLGGGVWWAREGWGRARVGQLDRALRRCEDRVLAPLPEPDRELFRTLLKRLATAADSVDPVGSTCAVGEELG